MFGKPRSEWIAEYALSHQHPANKACHMVGIPLIALSVLVFAASPFVPRGWVVATALFAVGWAFQFAGHGFERKPPEFFKDWRFLFVGLSWWLEKVFGTGV